MRCEVSEFDYYRFTLLNGKVIIPRYYYANPSAQLAVS